MNYQSTKILDLGSCAFRQWRADHSHCHFIHGYRLQAKFYFSATHLDDKNWVVDFGGLNELKKALEKQFDHTLCVAADDPCLDLLKQLHDKGAADLRIMEKGVGIERTAEWCLTVADEIIRRQTNNRCWVDKVEVWEHEKNSAIAVNNGITVEPQQNNNTVATTITPPLEQIATTVGAGINVEPQIKPVPLNNKVSSGFGNLYGGTSWGV